LLNDTNISSNLYQLGVSKIFIKSAQTYFDLEELRTRKLNDIVLIIQRTWRSCRGKAYTRKCIYAAVQIFYGKKERRYDTVFRPFRGDYIKFKESSMAKGITKKFNEKVFLFADKVNKINEKFDSQTRIAVVSETSLYNITNTLILPNKVHRRIMIKSIGSISVSTLQDNYFVIHVPSEYDYLYESPKKTEIVSIIAETYRELTQSTLTVTFTDKITLKCQSGKTRSLEFQKDESLTNKDPTKPASSKFKKPSGSNPAIVLAASGLSKESGRKRTKPVKQIQKLTVNPSGKGSKAPQTKFTVKAVHDYNAKSARELSFRAGEIINVLSRDNSTGLWQGELNGKRGIFPASHVQQM